MCLEKSKIHYINTLYTSSSGSKSLARAMFYEKFRKNISTHKISGVWKLKGLSNKTKKEDCYQVHAVVLRKVYNIFTGNLEKMAKFLNKDPNRVLESCKQWEVGKYFGITVGSQRIMF